MNQKIPIIFFSFIFLLSLLIVNFDEVSADVCDPIGQSGSLLSSIDFDYRFYFSYNPNYAGCPINWTVTVGDYIEQNYTVINEPLQNTQFDIVVTSGGIENIIYSAAQEQGKDYLFAANGTTQFTTNFPLSVGDHTFAIIVYGSAPEGQVPEGPTGYREKVITLQEIPDFPEECPFGTTVELDQKVYTWSDKVYITIVAPCHNFDSELIDEIGASNFNPIKISTRDFDINFYKLTETGTDTGIFTGEVILTGFVHDANGDGTAIRPGAATSADGTGPTNGFIETGNDDGLTVSFEFLEDETVVGSALIRWNIGEIQWLEASYPSSGTGVVRVIDPDMNLNPEAVDNFKVDVWSDSDAGGISLTVTETNEATGIFEGTVFFTTTDESSGSRLRVAEGDTVTAEYEDNTLPDPYTRADELDVTAITLIGSEGIEKYVIKLKTRDFIPKPSPENSIPLTGDKIYHLRQFENIPTSEEREELLQQGIALHSYVGGNAYIASSEASVANAISPTSKIKFVGIFNPEDKISKALLNKDIQPWARIASPASSTGFDTVITIQFNGGVDVNDAITLVKELGGDVISSASAVPIITASIDVDFVNDIANEFTVQYLDVVRPGLNATNNGARESANIIPLKKPLYDLAGEGITILVYDVKVANGEHPDFDTRVIESDPGLPHGPHSTHVAGTVGGSGINSDGTDTFGNENGGVANQWAGMAPEIQIRSFGVENSSDVLYDSGGDLNEDFATAIEHGIDLATMSLGNNVVSNYFPCELLGDYTSTALLIDSIVTGSINDQKLIFVQSAGNERNNPTTCGEFATISSPATSKNGIVVGAINSDDNSITHFTSYGPTDDGRLKPDIVAPGCESGEGGITSTAFTRDRYWTTCGTSMSTPVTSGAVSLLLEKWKSLHDSELLLPHTVKAILIHTAIDGDNNVGPDYKFGWGILDAQGAIDLTILDYVDDLITVDSIEHDITKSYRLTSDGTNNVKATLVWDDRFGTQLTTKSLVNDLNLRLTDPDGIVHEPYILNPDQPEQLAITGNDDTNNVEMTIGNAKQGEWIITVIGALVPFGPQEYTLIMTDIPIETNFEQEPSVTGLIMNGPTVNIFPTVPTSGEVMEVFVVFEDSEDVNYDIMIVQEGQIVLDDTAYQHDGRGMHATSTLSSSAPVDITITFQGYGVGYDRTGAIGEKVIFRNIVPEFGTLTVMLFGIAFFSILIISKKFKIFTNMQI